jgi:hypothetical protein
MPNLFSAIGGAVSAVSGVANLFSGKGSSSSSPTFELINVTDGAKTIAKELKVKKVTIVFEARGLSHTKEDGNTFIDTKVCLGPICEIEHHIPDRSTLDELIKVLNDKSSLYRIKSKGVRLSLMRAEGNEFSHSGDSISTMPGKLRFRQQLLQNITQVTFKEPSDGNTVGGGIQSLGGVLGTAGTALGLFNKVKSTISGIRSITG